MTTEDKQEKKECDFCRRDEGLKLFITRPVVGEFNSNRIDEESIETLYDLTKSKEQLANLIKWHIEKGELNYIVRDDAITMRNGAFQDYQDISLSDDTGLSFYYHTLRSGFLYVYFEHLNKWKTYLISEMGYLKEINDKQLISETLNKEPCDISRHRELALTITVPKPENANNIWLKYSDVEWTEDVKKAYKQNYSKYMDCINIPKYLNGTKQEHVYPLGEKVDIVPVNTSGMHNEHVTKGISFNRHNYKTEIIGLFGAWSDLKKEFDDLEKCKEAEKDDKKLRQYLGAMVCINDPVAIIQDIGGYLYKEKLSTDHLSPHEVTAQMLESLRVGMQKALVEDATEHINKKYPEGRLSDEALDRRIQIAEKNIAEDWEDDYQKYIKQHQVNQYSKSALAKEIANNEKLESTFGDLLVKYLESDLFLDHLDTIFDKKDLRQQAIFAEIIGNICENIICSVRVQKHLAKLLVGQTDKKNFLLNGVFLNSEKIKSIVNNVSYDMRGVLWGDLTKETSAVVKLMAGLKQESIFYNAVHKLFLQVASIILSIKMGITAVNLPTHVVDIKLNRVMLTISAIVETPIKTLKIPLSSPAAFYDEAARLIHSVNNSLGIKSDARRIKRDLRKVDAYNSFKSSGKINLTIPVLESKWSQNSGSIMDILKSGNGNSTTLYSKPTVLINPNAVNDTLVFDNILREVSQHQVNFGISGIIYSVNSLFQVLGLWSVVEGVLKGSYQGKTGEAISRCTAGAMAVSMAFVDIADRRIAQLSSVGNLKNGSGLYKFNNVLNWVKTNPLAKMVYFKGFPIAIGCMTGLFDVYNGIKDYKSGKTIDGIGLGISGFSLAASPALIVLGGVGIVPIIGWGLLVVGVISSAILIAFKQNDIQIWIRRSLLGDPSWYFGIERYEPYSSFDEQQKEWNRIVGQE